MEKENFDSNYKAVSTYFISIRIPHCIYQPIHLHYFFKRLLSFLIDCTDQSLPVYYVQKPVIVKSSTCELSYNKEYDL